jgi:two-component system phosphate regulon sensor histidine kinase PhoR
VERHGGTISCRSVEGEGSTFTFRLPLAYAGRNQQLQSQER